MIVLKAQFYLKILVEKVKGICDALHVMGRGDILEDALRA